MIKDYASVSVYGFSSYSYFIKTTLATKMQGDLESSLHVNHAGIPFN